MSAFMIVQFSAVSSFEWVSDYATKVPAVIRKYGGEYLAISAFPPTIERGEGTGPTPLSIVLLRFPTTDAAKAFLASPEYAPYRKARRAASESDFFIFENDEAAPQWRA